LCFEKICAALNRGWLLQFRIFGLRFLQDENVDVGVFPGRKKILIRSFRFFGVALNGVGATKLKKRKRSSRRIKNNSWMVTHFLELRRCFLSLTKR